MVRPCRSKNVWFFSLRRANFKSTPQFKPENSRSKSDPET
jgi:hypothetical protein